MSDETPEPVAELAPPPAPHVRIRSGRSPFGVGVMQLAGLASIGAGIIHAGAVGIHADDVTLARLFVACAVAQVAVGLLALVRGGRLAAALTLAVNGLAVGAWAATRLFDISWIAGLEHSEAPAFTDTVCAALGAIAVVAALAALIRRRTAVTAVHLGVPAWAIGSFVVVAMLLGATHDHGDGEAAAHTHDDAAAALAPDTTDGHSHAATDDGTAAADPAGLAAGLNWPRAYDPTQPIDVSGVAGVTRAEELRAAALIRRTQDDLPALRRCHHGGSARLPVDR